MDITLERVERLREKADVSYAQAKEALEYSNGDLLDALIYLEEEGAIPRPEGGCYSTRGEKPIQTPGELIAREEQAEPQKESIFQRVRFWLLENELEIWHKGNPVTSMPILILILLLILAAWAVVPIGIVSLFFGCRFRFSGPDLDRDELNSVMEEAADTADDLGRQVVDELRRQHEKQNTENVVPPDGGENEVHDND